MNSFKLFFESLTYLGFFAAIVLSWYFYLKARNRERLALIEKGVNISEIYKKRDFPKIEFPWLKLGILATGLGIGLCITTLIVTWFPRLPGNGVGIPAILLSGGIAMIIASNIRSRSERRNG